MSECTPADLAAMRRRWAKRRAAREMTPPRDLSPDELHQRAIDESRRKVAHALRHRDYLRGKADEADEAGERGMAKELREVASRVENNAALEVANRRERERGHARWQLIERNRQQARKARPGARSALRVAILETLHAEKRSGVAFKVLMRRWGMERIGSLRLDDVGGGKYRVTDENGDDDTTATYKLGYLEKLYSLAGA